MDVLHTAINVSDIDETAAFYEDLLGLHRTREFEVDGVRNYCVGGGGTAEIQFREVAEPGDPAGIDHLSIATDDVDATVASAIEEWNSSVEMGPESVEDGVRLAFITDPEGYTVELIENSES
ncbi:VOC family protein [Natrinema soli]|uniref:VOC family protein n=1 Tax=Natrinema soli TaxID=1930624 RepID=A0ABD5SP57_9EURY|nr:VOC family protein [Natrinema soli]